MTVDGTGVADDQHKLGELFMTTRDEVSGGVASFDTRRARRVGRLQRRPHPFLCFREEQ